MNDNQQMLKDCQDRESRFDVRKTEDGSVEYLGRLFRESPAIEPGTCTGCDLRDPTREGDEYHLCDQVAAVLGYPCSSGTVYKEGGLKRPEKVKFGGEFHVHIKIQDALCWDDEMLSGFLNDGERTLSAQEAREVLFACQAKGHTYFCGCDNPGYDGRCAGHE